MDRGQLTEVENDRIIAVYREVGSIELAHRRLGLSYQVVRSVLLERGVMKPGKKGAVKRGVIEKESDGPVAAAPQIGSRPLFDIVRETLVGFDQGTMTYRGRVWNLDPLMREVNRQRKLLGMPQVSYNSGWLV